MKKISVREICEKYGLVKITVQNAFQSGKLPGGKDEKGRWIADEKDAKELYEKPQPPEWQPIEYHLRFSSYSREDIKDSIDMGLLDSKENFWGIFIHHAKWKKNMIKGCCDAGQCSKIKDELSVVIVNKCGIHLRPTSIIGRIMMRHPTVDLYMHYRGNYHELNRCDLSQYLLSLNISGGSNIVFKAKGCLRSEVKSVLSKLKLAVSNGFWIDKKVDVNKMLDL